MNRSVIWAATVAVLILWAGVMSGAAKEKSQLAEWQKKDKGKPILDGQVCRVDYEDSNFSVRYKIPVFIIAVRECRGDVDLYRIKELGVVLAVDTIPTHRATFTRGQRIRFYLQGTGFWSLHSGVKMIEPDQILNKLRPFALIDVRRDVTLYY